ncbi:agenet domain-containing protein [Tanacetum coccineum]
MDPNSSLGKICLGENIVEILSDKVKGSGDWNSPEFQDTANSGQMKETKAMVFYQMDTEEVSDRFVAPYFVNGLEAYNGEINIGVEENKILNEYAVQLCLKHEVKKGNKVVKKELIVALRAITDFEARTVTIYLEIDPFLEDIEEEEKSLDYWDHLLDFNLDDVPLLGEEELLPFVCKMGKSSHNKKRAMENLNFFYQDIGTSSSAGGHLTQEEAPKEALAIRMNKVELDGKIVKEEEEAVKRIKGEALKEKDNPRAFIFPIRLEGQVNKNALADTGSDINTMPYRIYKQLGKKDIKKVDRGITMINHTQRLFLTFDGFCHQTFRATRSDVMRNAESDSDDEEEYQIKRNKFGAPIYGLKPAPYLNCNDPAERSLAIQIKPDYKGCYTKEEEATGQWRTEIRLTDPYGNIYLQGFTTKKTGRKLSKYHKLSDIMSPNWFTMGTHDDEAGSSRSKHSRQHEIVEEVLLPQVHHEFLLWEGCSIYAKSRVKVIRCDNGTEFKNMVMNKLCEMKGIKREFSVARTPQQNGVAKRKNRTIIEAAKTMLADLKLTTTFWDEAINTAYYV